MVDKIVKVAVYARVSTQEQAVEGTSLEYQQEQLEKYCESQGWEIFQTYVDAGYTGKDDNRPGLKRLLTDAKSGLFDKVVVFRMDRLARNLRLLLEIEEKLKECGISFHSVKETFDTSTASGRHFLQMLGMISEWERETIIERTKAGRLQRYREGCWGPGRPPFGYAYDRKTKKLIINENHARIVRRIYEEYVKGRSMWGIANLLNTEHIPTRRNGKGWRNTSVRDVLIDSVYKGAQIVNVHQAHKGIPKELPETAIHIQVPAIVGQSVWDLAQERRKNNKHLQPPKYTGWLLQGLITCGFCGRGFKVEYDRNRRSYSCRGRLKYAHVDGSPRCTSPRLNAERIEGEVWQKIEAIINDPNKLESLLKETVDNLKNREADLNVRIKPVDERLAEIAEQKARLAEEFVQLNVDSSRYKELKSNLEQEESRLRSVRSGIDPQQLEELEQTRSMLQFWQKQLESMAWNTEMEDGSIIKVMEKPHKTALKIVGFEDKEITEIMRFPATRRELIDMLQVRLVVFMDIVEVKAVFPIEAINCQSLCSEYR